MTKSGGGGRRKGARVPAMKMIGAANPAVTAINTAVTAASAAKKASDGVKTLGGKVDAMLKSIPRGTFATLGGQYGGPKGAALGGALSLISGYGQYTVRSNSLMTDQLSGPEADNVPTFSTNDNGTRIRHRELVGNVASGGANFVNTAYPIDPTNSSTFPWLAALTTAYQKYKVHGMVFYYKTTSTDYNNSGTVQICVQYDATQNKFTSTSQLLNSQFAVSTKPSISVSAPVECDPKIHPLGGYYLQHAVSDNPAVASDPRFSVLGILNVATEGCSLPAGVVLGQLWVTYDIEFINPYVIPGTGTTPQIDSTSSGRNDVSFSGPNVVLGTTELISSNQYLSQFSVYNASSSFNGQSCKLVWTDKPQLVGKKFTLFYTFSRTTGTPMTTTLDTGFGAPNASVTVNSLAVTNYGTAYVNLVHTFTVNSATGSYYLSPAIHATGLWTASAQLILINGDRDTGPI